MAATLITAYLSEGLAAARPATPLIATGGIAFYFATDTATLSFWNGSAWVNGVGGYNPGVTPTVVQVAHAINGDSVTFGVAPTNGNLLVAMSFNPNSNSAGSGWVLAANNGSGADFGNLLTKTAGAGESTTQSPTSGAGSPAALVVWEINGATSGIILASLEAEQTGQTYAVSPIGAVPFDQGLLFLGAIGLVSSTGNFVKMFGVVQDAFVKTGSGRQLAAGHAHIGNFPIPNIAATISGASSYKAMGILLSV